MEQKLINYSKMVSNTMTGMEQEKVTWENEPEIMLRYNSIKKWEETIGGKNQLILGIDKTGYTAAKDNQFDEITTGTGKLMRQMSAYAKIKKDYHLLPLVDISMSALTRGPEKETIDRCGALVEKASQMLPQLSIVKISTEQLDKIRLQIKVFYNSLTERSSVSTNLTVSAEEINSAIAGMKIDFDILDDLVEGIIEDESFIARYKIWRKIPDFGKGKTLKNPEKPVIP